MINFIICDDEKAITDIVKNIITKAMFKTNIDYKIHIFNDYDSNFYNISNSDIENKIYILDIEVGKNSGIDVAKKIRNKDWYSVIVILTSHYELEYLTYKSRLLVLDFISKFDLYDQKIYDVLNLCIENKLENKKLIVKINRKIEQIEFNNILYIAYDSYTRKVKIVTKTKEYEVNDTLKDIAKELKGKFVYTHRACIVNMNNVETIDTVNKIITFENGNNTNLVSRNHLKDLKEYICSKK